MLGQIRLRIAAATVMMLVLSNVQAQDPIFSQFYAAPLQINPAFVGSAYAPRITLNYRNQWPSFNNAYITYAASYEQFIEPVNSGIGFMIQSDESGDGIYRVNQFTATYGYQLQVNRDFFVRFGVEGGITRCSVDWNRLVFLDQIDPINGATDPFGNLNPTQEGRPENLTNTYFDIGAGLLAYGPVFYGGISMKHLNTPDESILGLNENLNIGLPMRLTAHAGAEITLRKGNKHHSGAFISPNVLFIKQGGFGQINAGAYGSLGMFFAGLWYRHALTNSDAAIMLAGYQHGIFKIGYSYDMTISGLAAYSGGAHEVSLTINFGNSDDAKRRRSAQQYNDCFRMFR